MVRFLLKTKPNIIVKIMVSKSIENSLQIVKYKSSDCYPSFVTNWLSERYLSHALIFNVFVDFSLSFVHQGVSIWTGGGRKSTKIGDLWARGSERSKMYGHPL